MKPTAPLALHPAVAVAAAAALALLAPSLTLGRLGAQGPGGKNVDVIVGFDRKPGPDDEDTVKGRGGKPKKNFHLIDAVATTVPEGAIDALRKSPHVTAVEPDGIVQIVDAELDNSWGVKKIGAGTAQASGYRGAGATAFVIDTGIAWDHPDLQANWAQALSFDFVNGDSDPYDDNSHGTHVAGTIAALDNNAGVVGVAPQARIASLKALNGAGQGKWSDVIEALEWAVDHGAQLTNSSFGDTAYPGTLVEQAYANAEAAGVVNIAAAGNNGNCGGKGDNVIYPARFTSVIAVAATDSANARPCFSSTGSKLEFAAPGVSVISTIPGNQYAAYSGTSMASPHVTGLVALLLGAGLTDANHDGRLTDEVRAILSKTATDLGTKGRDALYGFGLVNAPAALALLTSGSTSEVATVSAITYAKAAKSLNISVTIVDASQKAIAGAAVTVSVTKDGGPYTSGTATAANNGLASFQIKNAPKGCYQTDVTGVTKSGYAFTGGEPSNSFCL